MIVVMKSPFTGKDMEIVYEVRTWNFRGEQYEYTHAAYRCVDTGEQFTSEEMEEAGYLQVTNQYRIKYGLPFTDEIADVRNRYGLSAAKMAQIMGFGINQWRSYEAGEVPSVSNGRMIRSIARPAVFLDYVESSRNVLGEKDYAKIRAKVEAQIDDSGFPDREVYDLFRVYQCDRGQDNGYAQLSLPHLKNVLLYILSKCGEVFYTKMNKLLFYSDFLSYRRHGVAMTGLSYRALTYGPVPEKWDNVYSQFDEIIHESRFYGDKEGCVLLAGAAPDLDSLSPEDLNVLDEVCSRFAECNSVDMTEISHKEQAWLENVDGHKRIPFDAAFKLKAI